MTVQREVIRVETVMGDQRNPDDSWDFMLDHEKRIGYIRISAFSRDTARQVRRAMEQLKRQGLRGLVLDLRFNPGGLLDAAVEISDLFISKGRIVSTKNRDDELDIHDAKKPGTFEGFPMVVLVNRYSASASEIVSACLQDHKRAVIIGERTWGKGSVQNVIPLEGGGALKLTIAGYFRPSGKNIHRLPNLKETDDWGVQPDKGFKTSVNMAELIAYRRNRDIVPAKSPGASPTAIEAPPENAPAPFVDTQLEKALSYINSHLKDGAKGQLSSQ